MKNLKAQAAMEYLMTYGWAILIVVIVAAALFALGIFSPPTGTRCSGFANLGCPTEWQYDSTAVTFTAVLKNAVGQPVTVTAVDYTVNGETATGVGVPYNIAVGATQSSTSAAFIGNGVVASGNAYSVQVEITYTVGSGTLSQKDTGTLSGAAI